MCVVWPIYFYILAQHPQMLVYRSPCLARHIFAQPISLWSLQSVTIQLLSGSHSVRAILTLLILTLEFVWTKLGPILSAKPIKPRSIYPVRREMRIASLSIVTSAVNSIQRDYDN